MTVPPNSPSDTDDTAADTGDTPDPAAPATPDPDPTPGGDDLGDDLEKWKRIARKHEARAKANAEAAEKLKKLEDEGKSEGERREEALATITSERDQLKQENLRLTVALDKAPEGMPLSKVKKLAKRLTGGTLEDLEADAEELFAEFTPTDTDGSNDADGGKPSDRRLPKERLKTGSVPNTEPEETDPNKLAALVPRRY